MMRSVVHIVAQVVLASFQERTAGEELRRCSHLLLLYFMLSH